MITRRFIENLKQQHWTGVVIELVIVVLGVFIGLQANNWNERREFRQREIGLLKDLRADIVAENKLLRSRGDEYREVSAAGQRALAALDDGTGCKDHCVAVIVDLMHASQWVSARLSQSTFQEMRRLGLPRAYSVSSAVGAYYSQNMSMSDGLDDKPAYRTLVRGLVPLSVQTAYWNHCYAMQGGIETLKLNCPLGISNEQAARIVAAVAANPQIVPTLTEWTGFLTPVPRMLEDDVSAGERAIAAIDQELAGR